MKGDYFMLKIVGTENGEIVDEKVILDDNNKPTKFAWKLVLLEIVLDICIFSLIYSIVKKFNDK